MDLRYIKLIVESYYNDSDLVKTIYSTQKEFVDDIYPEIETIIASCRLENIDTYYELYNYDKGKQQKILYSLIEQSLYDRYPDQYLLYETNYDELYDKVLVAENLGSLVAHLAVPAIGALGILFAAQTTPVNKRKWALITKFHQINEKIHKFISNMTKAGRVRSSIVFNNAEDCYKQCNIHSKEDISSFIAGSLRNNTTDVNDDSVFSIETAKGRNQAYCLTSCYLKWTLNQVKELVQSYVACLRQTGERGYDVNDIQMAIMSAPSSSMCSPYYDLLKEHRKKFEDVLDVICRNSVEKEEYERMYADVINEATRSSGKINSNKSYSLNKQFFTHKKK